MINSTFIEEILSDIDWRVSELSMIKTLPIIYNFSSNHKRLHYKYSVPAIYSLWEGFVKTTLETYTRFLNTKNLKRNDIANPLLAHILDSNCDFNNPRNSESAKIKMAVSINTVLIEMITVPPKVPTESNVNFKVLNKILGRFCIKPIDDKYKTGMNKFLLFRNKVSHGDNAIIVEVSNIIEFIKLVEDLMLDVIINIEESYSIKTYLKNTTSCSP